MSAILALMLSILVGSGSLAEAETVNDHRYSNEDFGFSFEYPGIPGAQIEERGPDHPNQRLFEVEVEGTAVPFMTVGVFVNPDSLELREYACRWVWTHGPEEIGVEQIRVDGHDAIRATYFTKAGTGCATSVVFISHADRIIVVNARCDSAALPQILASFLLSP